MTPELVAVPFEDPRVQSLITDFGDEMAERYGEPGLSEAHPHDFDPPAGVFLLALLEDGRAVGCGGLRTLEPGLGEVKRMYVAPDGRGRGTGRALLRALVQRAREQGMARLLLETGTEQPEAMALYAAEGWTGVPPYGTFRDDPRSVCFALDL